MLRCPSCRGAIAPPDDKKLFDCESCQAPLKRRGEGLRNYLSQFLFVFLLISLVLAGVGTITAVVLAAGAGGGLWYWLRNQTLTVVQES